MFKCLIRKEKAETFSELKALFLCSLSYISFFHSDSKIKTKPLGQEFSQMTLKFCDPLGGLTGLNIYIVMLLALICYSKRIQRKIGNFIE